MEICKVCGARLEVLTEYHCNTHGFTKDEYREKYGNNKQNGFRGFSLPKRTEPPEIQKMINERLAKYKRKQAMAMK